MILDNILKKIDDETKNTLIKVLVTHDKEDVWIQAIPVYEDICHEGHIIMRYIKDIKYAIGVKNEAASYVDSLKGNEPHTVTLKLDED